MVLTHGVEELWVIERVVKFIGSLGSRSQLSQPPETESLKGAGQKLQQMMRSEATSKRLGNAVMQFRWTTTPIKCYPESSTQDAGREDSSVVLWWLVENAGHVLSRCLDGRDGRITSERLHGKRPHQYFIFFGEELLARPISTDSLNRNNEWTTKLWVQIRHVAQAGGLGK